MDTEDFIPFITWNLSLKFVIIYGRHCRAISKVILLGWYCPAYCFNHVIIIYFIILVNYFGMNSFIQQRIKHKNGSSPILYPDPIPVWCFGYEQEYDQDRFLAWSVSSICGGICPAVRWGEGRMSGCRMVESVWGLLELLFGLQFAIGCSTVDPACMGCYS